MWQVKENRLNRNRIWYQGLINEKRLAYSSCLPPFHIKLTEWVVNLRFTSKSVLQTNKTTDNTHSECSSLYLVVMMSTTHLGIEFLDSISLSKSSLVRVKLGVISNALNLLASWQTCTSSSQCCCLQPTEISIYHRSIPSGYPSCASRRGSYQ